MAHASFEASIRASGDVRPKVLNAKARQLHATGKHREPAVWMAKTDAAGKIYMNALAYCSTDRRYPPISWGYTFERVPSVKKGLPRLIVEYRAVHPTVEHVIKALKDRLAMSNRSFDEVNENCMHQYSDRSDIGCVYYNTTNGPSTCDAVTTSAGHDGDMPVSFPQETGTGTRATSEPTQNGSTACSATDPCSAAVAAQPTSLRNTWLDHNRMPLRTDCSLLEDVPCHDDFFQCFMSEQVLSDLNEASLLTPHQPQPEIPTEMTEVGLSDVPPQYRKRSKRKHPITTPETGTLRQKIQLLACVGYKFQTRTKPNLN